MLILWLDSVMRMTTLIKNMLERAPLTKSQLSYKNPRAKPMVYLYCTTIPTKAKKRKTVSNMMMYQRQLSKAHAIPVVLPTKG